MLKTAAKIGCNLMLISEGNKVAGATLDSNVNAKHSSSEFI
jgi:hypothetical protein